LFFPLNPECVLEAVRLVGGGLVSLDKTEFDGALAELREQGLKVTVFSALNETWYIKDDGLFTGYIVSGAELLELKSANKLDIRGIKSLG
jgi:hypothetical protein